MGNYLLKKDSRDFLAIAIKAEKEVYAIFIFFLEECKGQVRQDCLKTRYS